MTYDIIINGVPVGEVEADSEQEAKFIARSDEGMNEENAPFDAIWAELK